MIPFQPFPNIHGEFLGRPGRGAVGFAPKELIQVKQVHGDRVWVVRHSQEMARLLMEEGDALITGLSGLKLGVRTADCIPILMAHPKGIIAAVHAGWRGTLKGITGKALEIMREEFGVEIGDCRITLGPSICRSCFEVGAEVADSFREVVQSPDAIRPSGEKFLLDLRMVNLEQILVAGVPRSQVEIREECTRCQEDRFFSYRGAVKRDEGNEGRNFSWIQITKEFESFNSPK